MGDASFLQANFLGGEWSPYGQGRADIETYRTALNRCSNYIPLEVGAATRRPGTLFIATTRKGVAGVLRQFHFSQDAPYNMEFTPGHMRLIAGRALVLEEEQMVSSFSTDNPAKIGVPVATTWATGDEVEFTATSLAAGGSPSGPAPLFNRQFEITVIDDQHFTIADPVTGAGFDGSTVDLSGWTLTVAKVVDYSTSYTAAELSALRVVQDDDVALVLHGSHKPMALESVTAPVAGASATFSWTTPTFLDGPYLDPPDDGSYLTPSGLSGTITLTASSTASINGGQGFLSTDVGRMVRLFSEPDDWASGTAYSAGTNVKYDNAYYQALQSNTGIEPDTDDQTHWTITTTAAKWTWGLIATVVSTTQVTVTLATGGLLDRYQQPLAGGALLYTNSIKTWRLGLFSDTTGYPTGGVFYEGRFHLFGVLDNRFDATMSGENYNFAPTLLDGTVADNNGMSEVLKGEDRNTIFWMVGTPAGIAAGTQGGEWSIQASQLNEPLTPTSIQSHKVTRYGCANVEPRNTGLSHVFVQRYQKQVFEYLTDVFSGKFIGTNIARKAKHLTSPGIAEIAYQAELAPVVWARTNDNTLLGCTYKRESPFSTQPASFMGWHQHSLGSGRKVESIQAGPSPDGTTDSLMMITNDTSTGIRYIEQLASIFEETAAITDAWFLDAAVVPTGSEVKTVGGVESIVFYGLDYLDGKTVTAWIGGVDAGDYTVSGGTITVPIDGSANALLTTSLLATLTTENDFGVLGANILLSPQTAGFASPVGSALDYTYGTNYSLHSPQEFKSTVFDWEAQRFYALCENSVGTVTNVEIMNIASRAEVANASPGELANAEPFATCIGYDGHIYFGTGDGTQLVCRWNTTSHAVDLTYDDSHSLMAAGYVAPITFGGDQFVAVTGLNSGESAGLSAPWYVINMTAAPSPSYVATGFFDEGPASLSPGNVYLCRGPSDRAFATAFSSSAIGIYVVAVEGPTKAGVGKIWALTPAAVDSGWSSFSSMGIPVYDETDGNIIFNVEGNDSTFRIVKISTANGSVLWKVTVTANVDYHTSRIRAGRFTYMDGTSSPYSLVTINTLTGATTSQSETSIGPTNFSTDDVYGQVVANVNDIGTVHWQTFGPASGGGPANVTPAGYYTAPQVIGFTYSSQLQILRTIDPQEAGAQNGPALGKTRRVHMHATLLANSQGCYFGTDFNKTMRKGRLLSAGRTTELAANVLFTGVIQDTLEDTYSFNSMWGTQTTRPYPTTIVSVECFLHTQDR